MRPPCDGDSKGRASARRTIVKCTSRCILCAAATPVPIRKMRPDSIFQLRRDGAQTRKMDADEGLHAASADHRRPRLPSERAVLSRADQMTVDAEQLRRHGAAARVVRARPEPPVATTMQGPADHAQQQQQSTAAHNERQPARPTNTTAPTAAQPPVVASCVSCVV